MGTDYANQEDRPREILEHPCLCLYGVTTPQNFWGGFSAGNTMDGSLARMIIMETEQNYPPRRPWRRADIPVSLVLTAQAIAEGADGHNAFPLGEHSSQAPKPYTVPYADDDAEKTEKRIEQLMDDLMIKYEGTGYNGVLNRLHELSVKIALVRAICENPKRPVITKEHLEWGYLLAKISTDSLLKAVKELVSDNEQEAKLKRVYSEIAKAGAAGISKTGLSRVCKFMGTVRALNEVLDMLIQSGMVRLDEVGEIGRKKRIYYDVAVD